MFFLILSLLSPFAHAMPIADFRGVECRVQDLATKNISDAIRINTIDPECGCIREGLLFGDKIFVFNNQILKFSSSVHYRRNYVFRMATELSELFSDGTSVSEKKLGSLATGTVTFNNPLPRDAIFESETDKVRITCSVIYSR